MGTLPISWGSLYASALGLLAPAAVFAQVVEPLPSQLEETERGRLLLALVGLALLGLILVAAIYLGGRMTRRIARQRPIERTRPASDWERGSRDQGSGVGELRSRDQGPGIRDQGK